MEIRFAESGTILSPVSGYLLEAGFSHSLTPARNCTFACTYCYVPEMRVQGGLRREDWERWGQFTTVKRNAAELLARELRPNQRIYCSPLTDPYQPAEAEARAMPEIWRRVGERPPAVFVLQTRGPLVVRDGALLEEAGKQTRVRVSFSVPTMEEAVRRRYEPRCAPVEERLRAMETLAGRGLAVFATVAPILPVGTVLPVGNKGERRFEEQARATVRRFAEAGCRGVVVDALHTRRNKPRGATTRPVALRILEREAGWLEVEAQAYSEALRAAAEEAGLRFGEGPSGFAMLAEFS